MKAAYSQDKGWVYPGVDSWKEAHRNSTRHGEKKKEGGVTHRKWYSKQQTTDTRIISKFTKRRKDGLGHSG